MKNIGRGVVFFVLMSLVFFSAGCGKKGIQQTDEVTPPEKQVSPSAPSDMGGMQMPGSEGGVQAMPQGTLSGDAATFEDEDIYFDYDKFNISPDGRKVLAEKATYMNTRPNMKVRIEGHCDERGTSEYNLALGERRAKAVQDYLLFLGISPDRISTVSFGEEKPADPGNTEEAYAKNRRAHFVIVEE